MLNSSQNVPILTNERNTLATIAVSYTHLSHWLTFPARLIVTVYSFSFFHEVLLQHL